MHSKSSLPPSSPKEFQLFRVHNQSCYTRHCRCTRFSTQGTRAHTQTRKCSLGQAHNLLLSTPRHDQDLVGQSERTSGLLQLKGEKHASQNIDGACRLCQPSVPKGIKQACQTEHKGGRKLTAQLRKASKNSTHPGQIFFFHRE